MDGVLRANYRYVQNPIYADRTLTKLEVSRLKRSLDLKIKEEYKRDVLLNSKNAAEIIP